MLGYDHSHAKYGMDTFGKAHIRRQSCVGCVNCMSGDQNFVHEIPMADAWRWTYAVARYCCGEL